MNLKKNLIRITLDLLMAITFALLMNPRVLNGLPFHEIAGLVIGVAILTHIGLNFRWVIQTSKKVFNPTLPGKTRFSYALNILLLISMATIIITGILISRVVLPSLAIEGSRGIRGLHNLSSNVTLALVGIHIGVHWKWIMGICKKMFKFKEGKWRKGAIVSAILSIAILAGGIQWFASTSSAGNGNIEGKRFEANGERPGFQSKNGSDFQGPPPGEFNGRHEGFDGRERHEGRGGGSPFLVILNYFAIFGVLTVVTYYLEKRILRKRKLAKSA